MQRKGMYSSINKKVPGEDEAPKSSQKRGEFGDPRNPWPLKYGDTVYPLWSVLVLNTFTFIYGAYVAVLISSSWLMVLPFALQWVSAGANQVRW